MSDNPKTMSRSVWQGSFTVFGVELHCHVLDDGQRVIEEDGMHRLMEAMGGGSVIDAGDLEAFARWQKGACRS